MAGTHALVISADTDLFRAVQEAFARYPDATVTHVASVQEVKWHMQHGHVDLALLHLASPADRGLLESLAAAKTGLPTLLMVPSSIESLPLAVIELGSCGVAPLPASSPGFTEALDRAVARLVASDTRPQPLTEAAEEAQQRSLSLAAILDAAQELAAITDVQTLLDYVADIAAHLTMADEGLVLMPRRGPPPQGVPELVVRAACGATQAGNPQPRIHASLAAMVYQAGKPILTVDSEEDGADDVSGGRLRSLIMVPIRAQGEISGVLSIANRHTSRAFDQEDLLVLSALASVAGIALQNARFHAEARQSAATEILRETVATLSHHVNNPLAALVAGIHTLSSHISGRGDDKKSLEMLGRMQRKANEISAVIAVLQEIAVPTSVQYWKQDRMIDIEAELAKRIASLETGPARPGGKA